jgi:hypothetical protein
MKSKSEDYILRSIQKLTSKRQLQTNLVRASLFITAFEVLKATIVDQIRDFYSREISRDGRSIETEEYKREVQRLNKNKFIASCLWLKESDAISEVHYRTENMFGKER